MKTYEKYINRNKLKYGDYIIIKKPLNYSNLNLYILQVYDTPGPKGHKVYYYSLHIIKQFNDYDDNIIEWVPTNRTISIDKEELENGCLYVTDTLEDAEKHFKIIKDSSKFNI